MDLSDLPELHEVVRRLPWFRDLSHDHRTEMLSELVERLVVEGSREEFTAILAQWSDVAHQDLKWSRLVLLRESGLLEPPHAA